MFAVGDGISLDAFMQGSIMAQAKVVSEASDTPDEAIAVLAHYFNIAADAIPLYWSERSGRTALQERGK